MPDTFDLLLPKPDPEVPTYRFGTVTSVDPLRVRLDGESSPVPSKPVTLIAPDVGDRVLVHIYHRQMVILGKVGGQTASLDLDVRGDLTVAGAASIGETLTVDGKITGSSIEGGTQIRADKVTTSSIEGSSNQNTHIYLETTGNGRIRMPGVRNTTTTASANVYVGTTGALSHGSSAARYKVNAEPVPEEWHKRVLDLEPQVWLDRMQVEGKCGAEAVIETDEGPRLAEGADIGDVKPIAGLIAEHVEAAGLETYVSYDEDGRVEGLDYDRLWTLLIPIVREQQQRIADLEATVQELRARLDAQE